MPPVHRILVATDFSSHARFALDRAQSIAKQSSARVEVVYVWLPPEGLSLVTKAIAESGRTLSDLARTEASRRMRDFLADGSPPCPRTRVEVGVPHEVIVTLAAAEKFDLIVMGAVGAGANPSRVGSCTLRVLDAAPCPVLTLRAPAPPRASPGPEPGTPS